MHTPVLSHLPLLSFHLLPVRFVSDPELSQELTQPLKVSQSHVSPSCGIHRTSQNWWNTMWFNLN